jgi:DNA-binding transcriptional MerR regulator
MPIQGEFFEKPGIVLATMAAEEAPTPPPAVAAETLSPPMAVIKDTPSNNDKPSQNTAAASRKNMKDLSIPKLYYSISEVSRLTGLEPYVLRYWETEFDVLHPQKNRAGNRVYSNRDIKFILRIKELLREQRYTIEGAKAILKSERNPDAKPQEETVPENDPAQIPLVSEARPTAPTAFLTLQEIRSMKQSLLDLRAILVK